MNKNRIQGRPRGDELAQHSEVAGSVAEVNAAVAPGSNAFLPGEIPRRKCLGKSAEAIVALKSAKVDGAKGRTDRLALDRGMDIGAVDARMGQVFNESRPEGRMECLGLGLRTQPCGWGSSLIV